MAHAITFDTCGLLEQLQITRHRYSLMHISPPNGVHSTHIKPEADNQDGLQSSQGALASLLQFQEPLRLRREFIRKALWIPELGTILKGAIAVLR